MIRAILACDEEWGIGKGGDLPWPHNPADLAWFKENTLDSTIVMGRSTWDSLPFKPLPNRHNVVVSSKMKTQDGVEVLRPDIYKSRCVTIDMVENVWIIGGAQLVSNSLSIIDEIWLSRIPGEYNCDTFLPRTAIELSYELYSSHYGSQKEGDLWIDKWRKL